MSIRNNLVKALARKHPQHIQELDKLLTKISNAQENLDTLKKHFDYDDIPF